MKDFSLDDNNDLKITSGDFEIAESDEQHVSLLAQTSAGQWRQSPSAGMGLNRFLLSEYPDINKMLHIANIQLQADGVTSKSVKFVDNQLNIDAKY